MKVLYTDYTDEAKLKELAEKHGVPGFNYCLIKNGVAGVTRAYGVQNAETGKPYEPSTIIEAASLTKTLFACLVMRLVDRGVLTLDEPIAALAPSVQVSQDERIQTIRNPIRSSCSTRARPIPTRVKGITTCRKSSMSSPARSSATTIGTNS